MQSDPTNPRRWPPRWLRIIFVLPASLTLLAMVYSAIRVIALAPAALGLAVLAITVVTAVLALRSLAAALTSRQVEPGELRGRAFDYLVWTAIGLPIIVVVALIIAVVASR